MIRKVLCKRTQYFQTHTVQLKSSLIQIAICKISGSRSVKLQIHMCRKIGISIREYTP